MDRNRLLAQLLLELEQCIDELAAHGTSRLSLAYHQRCSTIGQKIKATLVMETSAWGKQKASTRMEP